MLRRFLIAAVACALLGSPFGSSTAAAVSTDVVISQVYGGGGNSGATFKNDFIELFNRGTAAVAIAGWSVQYAASGGSSWTKTNLSGEIQPGQYYLVQEAAGSGGTVNLPPPDATGSIAMSATAGKVALVTNQTLLTCGASAGNCFPNTAIWDFVGYGVANNFEDGSAAPTLTNTTADLRNNGGCAETDNNGADFSAGTPTPRNALSPVHSCTADIAPSVTATSPNTGASGVALDSNITVTFSEPVNVSAGWFSINCALSLRHAAPTSGGPTTFTLDPDANFASNESCTVTVFAANVTDQDTSDPPDTMASDFSMSFTTAAPPVAIHDIQGASHISPMNNQTVSGVAGIVTARRTNGLYLQDPNADTNDATSEGIFVFTSSAPTVSVGDSVKVSGRVTEFRPGGASTGNLTTTEIGGPTVTIVSSGNALPAPIVLGNGGRVPPSEVIEDDATGSVETSGTFDPQNDGLDFYESVEGMRVQLNDAVAVGPTNSFGETSVVSDNGANASVRTARGGILLRANDGNPERIVADDAITPLPALNVGDRYNGPLVGVVDYNFGNFFLEVTQAVGRIDGGLQRETATAPAANELAVATFNFENLDPTDPAAKFAQLATYIVQSLRSPDLIGGEEVQDNNGATDNGTVDASATLSQLIAAIQAAGGPTYAWREIDPVNDQDGGEPGGNIRQVFLFRTDRGLSFIDRPGGTATTPTAVTGSGASTQLTLSPGRIDPTDPNGAWLSSRKPLAGEFLYRGQKVFVIVNHFNSKGGDDPLFGRFQPPVQSSAAQRHKQATIVGDFVSQLTQADPNVKVIVLGDLNDFEFSETVLILKNAGLSDFIETLPLNQRYSYEFEGNAQVLDHIMGSNAVLAHLVEFDAVHVNSEFADQASDHDPSVIRVLFNSSPTVSAGGPYAVDEGGSITLSASGSDPEGDAVTYAWDLDNNGTFETAGQSVSFSAGSIDGPATRTVNVRATDSGGLFSVASATVDVANVAPTASAGGPYSGAPDEQIAFSGSANDPAGAADPLTYQWDFDYNGTFAPDASGVDLRNPTHAYPTKGTYTVALRVTDDDGGASGVKTATVTVTNRAPTASAGGPYSVPEGGSVEVTASGSDADGDPLTYAWDLDNDGTFETPGQSATFSAATLDGPSTYSIAVRVSDGEATAVSTATVNVTNVAPTASAGGPYAGTPYSPVTFAGSATDPAGPRDTLTYAWDFEYDGTFAADASGVNLTSPSHAYLAPGIYTVALRVTDDDGGVSSLATATVTIAPPVTTEGKIEGTPKWGDLIKTKINVDSKNGEIKGRIQIESDARTYDSTRLDSIVVTGSDATVYGAFGSVTFRLDVHDGGKDGDTLRLRTTDGYDTGVLTQPRGELTVFAK